MAFASSSVANIPWSVFRGQMVSIHRLRLTAFLRRQPAECSAFFGKPSSAPTEAAYTMETGNSSRSSTLFSSSSPPPPSSIESEIIGLIPNQTFSQFPSLLCNPLIHLPGTTSREHQTAKLTDLWLRVVRLNAALFAPQFRLLLGL